MKSLILSMVAIVFAFAASAQVSTHSQDTIPTKEKQVLYLMKDSKMWIVSEGKKTEMSEDVTLSNGTIVKTDGTIQGEAGEIAKLKENQFIDAEGTIGEWKDDALQ